MIPHEYIEELTRRTDIVELVGSYVQLKRKGRLYGGLCPFHSEKTPSFYVYPDTQSFYCFGCQAAGDAISFVRKINSIDYPEAVKLLAARAGMPEPQEDDKTGRMRSRILSMNKEAARFFHACLNSTVEEARQARAYWRRRGLDDKTIARFGLGYAPDDGQALYLYLRDKGYNQQELDASGLFKRSQYDLAQDAQRLEYVKEAVNMLAERSNPTEQEVYAGRLAEETNISKTAIMTQLETAVKKAGNRRRWEKRQQVLKSGEMNQIKLPYSAGGSQALGIASAQQRLLAAILREPQYLKLAEKELLPEQFIQPQQKELYEAMLRCSREGIEINLTTLRAYVSEEALNELSRFAAQYSEVNCTPDDIRLYLDRIARGMPVAGKAAHMSNEELSDYLQSMREKKQGSVPVEE